MRHPRPHGIGICQVRIFAQNFRHGKIHHLQKSGVFPESRRFFLCEPKMNIHTLTPLWKTPVEKPVENVENSRLSTGISLLYRSFTACGKT
jgi:hypothetical protein